MGRAKTATKDPVKRPRKTRGPLDDLPPEMLRLIFETEMTQRGVRLTKELTFHETRKWQIDYALPESVPPLAIELEGAVWGGRHTRGKGYLADIEKYNQLTLHGWRLLRITYAMIKDESAVKIICQAIADGGKFIPPPAPKQPRQPRQLKQSKRQPADTAMRERNDGSATRSATRSASPASRASSGASGGYDGQARQLGLPGVLADVECAPARGQPGESAASRATGQPARPRARRPAR